MDIPEFYSNYLIAKEKHKKLVQIKRKNHYDNKIKSTNNKNKVAWSILNKYINRKDNVEKQIKLIVDCVGRLCPNTIYVTPVTPQKIFNIISLKIDKS